MSDSLFLENRINSIHIPDIFLIKSEVFIYLMLGNIFIMPSLETIESDDSMPK